MPEEAATGLGPVPSGRAAAPVVGRLAATITPEERRRLAAIAARLLRDEPALARTAVFGSLVSAGLTEAPAALFGDQREIGLFGARPEQSYEHRIALLASDGDLLVVERACPAHEQYVSDLLGVSPLRVIALGPPPAAGPAALASRCSAAGPVFEELAAAASRAGRFQIIPHIGAGSAWKLAGEIARATGVAVSVAAAPPRLTQRVNDKIWFAQRVREVLGRGALPPTFSAFGPAALAARLSHIARRSEKVIVKTPDSAGSLGNVAIDAAAIRRLDLSGVRDLVVEQLRVRGWGGAFPLLVGVWEVDAVASPSAQLWIPAPGGGAPVIEGVFEQRLSGMEAEFVGAVPADLSAPVARKIGTDALRLATLFQHLGYFGRCSFDCLVTTPAQGAPEVRWIECNGRWGGVSVPMTFANRVFGDWGRGGFVIVQENGRPLSVTGPEAVQARLGPLLLRRGGGHGVAPLSARWMERGEGVHFLAVAATQAEAEGLAEEALARLTARGG